MIEVVELKDPTDFKTAANVVRLYEGVFPIAPVLHEVMTGRGLMRMFLACDGQKPPNIVGAAILKSPETAFPLGADSQPIAWVISDVVTHSSWRKQGVARCLVTALTGAAIRAGGRIIYLYTEDTNEPAKRLYERTGFSRLKNQGDKAVFVKLVVE